MIESTKIAVFDFIKKGIIATFMVNNVSEYCILNSKILFQDKERKTLVYDPHTEKFYCLSDFNIYRFDMRGETFIVQASARTNQREIIITDLSQQGSVKIPNESLVCSCRFKDNILIFSENGNNYKYYDIARNTAEDNISQSGPKSAVKNQKFPAIILRKLTADFPQLSSRKNSSLITLNSSKESRLPRFRSRLGA